MGLPLPECINNKPSGNQKLFANLISSKTLLIEGGIWFHTERVCFRRVADRHCVDSSKLLIQDHIKSAKFRDLNGYRLDSWGSVLGMKRESFLAITSTAGLGLTQPMHNLERGGGGKEEGILPQVKRLKHEADNSPLFGFWCLELYFKAGCVSII